MESQSATLDLVTKGFEFAGVGVMVIGAVVALFIFATALFRRQALDTAYSRVRRQLERAILLGLELLIIADIIRSVALSPTFETVGTLALLIFVRTFLSWSIEVEIEGEWPWQRARSHRLSKATQRETEQ